MMRSKAESEIFMCRSDDVGVARQLTMIRPRVPLRCAVYHANERIKGRACAIKKIQGNCTVKIRLEISRVNQDSATPRLRPDKQHRDSARGDA